MYTIHGASGMKKHSHFTSNKNYRRLSDKTVVSLMKAAAPSPRPKIQAPNALPHRPFLLSLHAPPLTGETGPLSVRVQLHWVTNVVGFAICDSTMCVVKCVFSVVVYNWAQSLQEFMFWLVFARLIVGPIPILHGLCLSLSVFHRILHIPKWCRFRSTTLSLLLLRYKFRPTGNHHHQNTIHQPKKNKAIWKARLYF